MTLSDLYQRDFETGAVAKLTEENKRGFVGTTDWGLNLHIASVMAGATLASGTSFGLVMPVISAVSTRVAGFDDEIVRQDSEGIDLTETTDTGVGDIELRVRQAINVPLGLTHKLIPRIAISAGVVAPTGHFIAKTSGNVGPDTSRYVSVGRGVWWGLLDVGVFGRIVDRVGYMLQFASRYPMGTLEAEPPTDGSPQDEWAFRWGPEARVTAGLTGVIVKGRVNASLAMEMQWRDRGEEQFTKEDGFEPFANGGLTMYTVAPTLQFMLPMGFSASVNLRVPLAFEIYGTQPVNGIGMFAALNYSWLAKPDTPAPSSVKGAQTSNELIRKLIVPGKVTIIDYWATWCVPCKKLAPIVEAFAESRDDVVLKKVDLSELEDQRAYLPAVPGLPVVDIYAADGTLIERLIGPECFKFKSRIPAAASK